MQPQNDLRIRRFTTEDIDFGMHMKTLAGWNQLPEDWERFLAWEPEGCFVATWDGRPAGTAIAIGYDDRFGWVGMVLVDPEQRRKGIGRALLMACIEYLEARGVAAVKLDATPMGKQLYDTIGFHDEYLLERHTVLAKPQTVAGSVVSLSPERLSAVLELDFAAFGADRSRVLRALHLATGVDGFVALEGTALAGFAFVRPGTNARYLGPWVACGPEAAEALLHSALNRCAGQPLYVDISLANPHTATMVAVCGFSKQRHLIRMYRGVNSYPGDTGLVYGVAGPEIG